MSSPTRLAGHHHRPNPAIVASRAKTRIALARWLGIGAMAAGAGLAAYFLAQAGFLALPPDEPQVAIRPVSNPDQITGGKSRISGFDKNQQAFEITAENGIQDRDIKTLVHMHVVKSTFNRPSGAKLDILSDRALYDTKSKALNLEGNVFFGEGDRFQARMAKASVNMDDQSLASQSPVMVEVIGGTILADSLTISEGGNRILFKGGVKARFVTQR